MGAVLCPCVSSKPTGLAAVPDPFSQNASANPRRSKPRHFPAIGTQSYWVGSQIHVKEYFCTRVPVVGLRAFEKGCAGRASCGAMQQSLTDALTTRPSQRLLKHHFSTVTAFPLVNRERQSHGEYEADAKITHRLGEIFKTHQLPQRMRFQRGWNKDCQGNEVPAAYPKPAALCWLSSTPHIFHH